MSIPGVQIPRNVLIFEEFYCKWRSDTFRSYLLTTCEVTTGRRIVKLNDLRPTKWLSSQISLDKECHPAVWSVTLGNIWDIKQDMCHLGLPHITYCVTYYLRGDVNDVIHKNGEYFVVLERTKIEDQPWNSWFSPFLNLIINFVKSNLYDIRWFALVKEGYGIILLAPGTGAAAQGV